MKWCYYGNAPALTVDIVWVLFENPLVLLLCLLVLVGGLHETSLIVGHRDGRPLVRWIQHTLTLTPRQGIAVHLLRGEGEGRGGGRGEEEGEGRERRGGERGDEEGGGRGGEGGEEEGEERGGEGEEEGNGRERRGGERINNGDMFGKREAHLGSVKASQLLVKGGHVVEQFRRQFRANVFFEKFSCFLVT